MGVAPQVSSIHFLEAPVEAPVLLLNRLALLQHTIQQATLCPNSFRIHVRVDERRVDVTLTQHPAYYIRILSLGNQERCETMTEVVKSESRLICADDFELDRNGPNVVRDNRARRPWLLASQLE
jgi:hypothetical protein